MRACVSESRSVSPLRLMPRRFAMIGTALLGAVAATLCAQSAPSSSADTTQAQMAAQQHTPPQFDPRRPETQPSLSVDRDPIPSPDPEPVASAPTANAPKSAEKPGELQKGQNGVYTLHENVDEVLLNCTVIDDKGRPVEGLQ